MIHVSQELEDILQELDVFLWLFDFQMDNFLDEELDHSLEIVNFYILWL